jgi:hypothetical protein
MIFSVFISLVSLGFGVYKNIEAGNAKGFVYEQAYRVMGAVNDSNIGPAAKANILSAALGSLATPPPVIDLSRSSAAEPSPAPVCLDTLANNCLNLAGQLATLNVSCLRSNNAGDACAAASQMKQQIDTLGCLKCFTH